MASSDRNMNSVAPPSPTRQGGGDVEEDDEDRERYYDPRSVLKQAPRSAFWKYFKFKGTEKNGVDHKTVHCMLCLESDLQRMQKKDITYTGGTSNLKFHIENYHKDKLSELEEEEKSKKASQSSITSFAVNVPSSSQVKKWPKSSAMWIENTRLLAEWIVTSSRPFEIVEDPGFITYSNSIRPEYDVPCRKTITNYIEKEYCKKKDELKKELEHIEFAAVTTDGGSSTNAVSFQDVNVHFIDSNWEMKSATLAVTENKGEHTAARYREITDDIVEEFGLSDKIVLTVTDNENKMRAAFNDEERSGCCAHIIHSTTSTGLSSVPLIENVTNKTSKVATKHNKSCNFRYSVENEQAKAELKKRPIIQDVDHRWGSTKVSGESFLNHKDDSDKPKFRNFEAINSAINSLKPKNKQDREALQKLIFSLDDMQVVENLTEFLTKLDIYSTNLGGNFFVTSSVVIPTIKSIENLLKPNINDPYYMTDLKRIMREDIKERVKKNVNYPMMIMASALDPRFKKLKFIPSSSRDDVFKSLKTEAFLLLGHSRATTDEGVEENKDNSASKKRKVEVNYNESDDEEDEEIDEVAKEISRYRNEEIDVDKIEDPLKDFWLKNESKYPILSRLAKRFLCIPATSVEAERRFSDMGLLLTKRRLCMTGDHVDMCLFLKDKYRQEKKVSKSI